MTKPRGSKRNITELGTEGVITIQGGPRMTTARAIKAKWRKEWDLFQKHKLQKKKDAAALAKQKKKWKPRKVRVTKAQLTAAGKKMPQKTGRKAMLRSGTPPVKVTRKEIAIAAAGGALIPELIRQYNKQQKKKKKNPRTSK